MNNKWWEYISRQLNGKASVDQASWKKKAVNWYTNKEQLTNRELTDWDGDVVRGNLFQRDVDIIADSIWAQTPRFSVVSTLPDPKFQRAAAAVETLARRSWEETRVNFEVETCFREAIFGNIAFIKLDYDKFRQLPSLKWVEGKIAIDPLGHGDIRRAKWIAEILERPLVDFMHDNSIPKGKRDEVLQVLASRSRDEKIDLEQTIKVAYIWSKVGTKPWKTVTGRKLIVLTDVIEDVLLEDEWPWPFLDPDEFPIYMLRLKYLPGQLEGVTIFQLLEPLLKHYNWAASFSLADAKKAVQRKIIVSDRLEDPQKLESGKHMEILKSSGDPSQSIHVQDFGDGSNIVYQTLQFCKQMHDDQSGITNIVRGQSPGDRTTAEEARLLNRNSSILFQGVAKKLDDFLNEITHAYILSLLYYVPQWSRIVDMFGNVAVRSYSEVPIMDPMSGQISSQLQAVETPINPAEVKGLPDHSERDPGYIIRPGVDAWVGVDHAIHWMEYDIEQLKRDFSFSVEAGSARAEHAMEEQRNTLTMLQSLGPIYLQFQCFEQYYELVKKFINSFRMRDNHRLIPPMEKFLQGIPPTFKEEPSAGNKGGGLLTQPAAQSMGLNFGAEGLRGFGMPDNRMGNLNVAGAGGNGTGVAQGNLGGGVS